MYLELIDPDAVALLLYVLFLYQRRIYDFHLHFAYFPRHANFGQFSFSPALHGAGLLLPAGLRYPGHSHGYSNL